MRIRLNTHDELVGYFEIPSFGKLPEVTVWGSRTFLLRCSPLGGPIEPPPQDDCECIYDEVCAFAIVTEPISTEAK